MAYASLQDLTNRFGDNELMAIASKGTRSNPELDNDRIAQALEDASSFINGYLAQRFELPLPVVPKRVVAMACDVARYNLRNKNEGGGNTSDVVRDRFKDTRDELKAIAEGRIALDGIAIKGAEGDRVQFEAAAPVFYGAGTGLDGFCS